MSANKVIISGEVINPNKHEDLLKEVSGNENILSSLLKYPNKLIFYMKTSYKDKFGNNEDTIVACRFIDKNEFKFFHNLCNDGSFVYIMGHIVSDNTRKYYNVVIVDSYKKVKSDTPNRDLVLISGKTINTIGGDNKFIIVKSNNNFIDVYNINNDDETKYKTNQIINITGYLNLCKSIGSYKTGYADNIIFVSNTYNNYDISEYKKSKFYPEKFYSVLNKYNKIKFDNDSESDIFNNFLHINHIMNLNYDLSDIINFITAMKNKGLVILAGPSGTGKTQLVRCYAEALGLLRFNDSSHYLHISVSPSWTDDTDLLGYFIPKDKNKGTYYPSSSGLVKLLYDASKDPNGLYIVLLDEMNLSRIEYYFSQFLSILELPMKDPNRCIHLYNDLYKNQGNKIPSSIHIYNNILFVGTINVDESTKNITDKVLDRSNLITILSHGFKSNLFEPKNESKLNNFLNHIKPINAKTFYNMKKESNDNSFLNSKNTLAKPRLNLLNDLNYILKRTTYGNYEIGYREVEQINEFLCDLPRNNNVFVKRCMEQINKKHKDYKNYCDVAFDLQLSQRIFDKLSGSKYELYDFISILDNCMNSYKTIDENKLHKFGINNINLNTIIEDLKLNEIVKDLKVSLSQIPHDYSTQIIHHKWLDLRNYGFIK